MNEHARMKQLEAGLNTQGFLAHVLPDLAYGVVKPCDMIACGPHGRFWAVEGKAVEVPSWASKQTLIGPRTFRSHQLPSLLQYVEEGAVASVVLFVAPPRSAETRAWLLNAREIADIIARDGVLRLTDFDEEALACWELQRLPRGRWGLSNELRQRWYTSHDPDALHGWHPGSLAITRSGERDGETGVSHG